MHRYLSKARLVVYVGEDSEYYIVSFEPDRKIAIDPISLWALLRLDEQLTAEQLLKEVQVKYPDTSEREARSLFDKLLSCGAILESTDSDHANHAANSVIDQSLQKRGMQNLNVCLNNFPDVDPINNALVWLLWHCAECVSIVDTPQAADLVFHYNVIDKENLSDNINILVADMPDEEHVLASDFIISTSAAKSPFHLKWLTLPENALDFDEQAESLDRSGFKDGYAVHRLANLILDYLVGEKEVCEKKESSASQPKLTIGMATYDDYDGVYFSITSLQLHHSDVFLNSEIIILDNNPSGLVAKSLKNFASKFDNVRYEPYSDKNSTSVRDAIFHLATAPWVLCMDSHVMYPTGALERLLAYIQENADSNDFIQGPLIGESGEIVGTHFEPGWREGMYGFWAKDDRAKDINAPLFEIPMQGLGMFVCRKLTWPGFNKLFNGFGGEEGYIHEKIRRNGGKCLCMPSLRWSHRFERPSGVPYTNTWDDRIRNYLIGFEEIGYDVNPIVEHFTELVNEKFVKEVVHDANRLSKSPFAVFDHITCVNIESETKKWEVMSQRFVALRIHDRVKRFSAIHTPEMPSIGRSLSHRSIIERARKYGYESVLIFEDNVIALDGAEVFLSFALQEIQNKPWKILYLGGKEHRFSPKKAEGCSYLLDIPKFRITGTYALAFHCSVYDEVLDALPDNEPDMQDWVIENVSIDHYLNTLDSRYMVFPKPFTKSYLRTKENEKFQHFYK